MLIAIRLLAILTVLTGVLYPLTVSAVAWLFYRHQATGSVIRIDGRAVGSELLAQKFTAARYFWPRPSSSDYATVPAGASNLPWSSAELEKVVGARRAGLEKSTGTPVPAELLFASASGLDPHITPAAARYQIERIAAARGFTAQQRAGLQQLIERQTEPPLFDLFGAARVNVLRLNIALDQLR